MAVPLSINKFPHILRCHNNLRICELKPWSHGHLATKKKTTGWWESATEPPRRYCHHEGLDRRCPPCDLAFFQKIFSRSARMAGRCRTQLIQVSLWKWMEHVQVENLGIFALHLVKLHKFLASRATTALLQLLSLQLKPKCAHVGPLANMQIRQWHWHPKLLARWSIFSAWRTSWVFDQRLPTAICSAVRFWNARN